MYLYHTGTELAGHLTLMFMGQVLDIVQGNYEQFWMLGHQKGAPGNFVATKWFTLGFTYTSYRK